MDSLEAIFTYHNEPWNLSIERQAIVPASYLNSLWYYVESFFTSQHTDSLRRCTATLLNRITSFTEQQKIYLEKISALIHRTVIPQQKINFYKVVMMIHCFAYDYCDTRHTS
ncbi:MAG: hypothetical protein FJZ64_03535 [Chlamydiae bacterium]|nr:hypothetical protein [Chlamydiota bacterium]